jgi:subtilisin family serine protease
MTLTIAGKMRARVTRPNPCPRMAIAAILLLVSVWLPVPNAIAQQPPRIALYRIPLIDKQLTAAPSGIEADFALQNNLDRPLSRFALTYTIRSTDPELAVVAAASSDAVFTTRSTAAPGSVTVIVELQPNKNWAPGQTSHFTATLRLSPQADFTDDVTVSPSPFPDADANYNQINDALEKEVAQRLESHDPSQANAPLDIIVALNGATSESDLQTFRSSGGTLSAVFQGQGFASFSGTIPAGKLQAYAGAAGDRLDFIDPNPELELSLNLATSNSRATNVWTGAEPGNNRPDPDFAYTGNPQTSIAVIDSGIDASHAAFGGGGPGGALGYLGEMNFAGKIVGSLLCNETNCVAAAPAIDTKGHGSHVAGIIGARQNGANPPGVAGGGMAAGSPGVGLVAIRTASSNSASAITALRWIRANRAAYHIVGLNESEGLNGVTVPTWDREMDLTVQDGTPIALAAGNDFRKFRETGALIGSPALSRYAITVGAVDREDHIATYSSNGDPQVAPIKPLKPDVVAPGGDARGIRFVAKDIHPFPDAAGNLIGDFDLDLVGGINSVRPNPAAPPAGALPLPAGAINQYVEKSGTSMAAPHVAGEIALLANAITNYERRDKDNDGKIDEDSWNGVDDDRDDIVDKDVGAWNQRDGADLAPAERQNNARLLKSIILMTAWQIGQGTQVPEWAKIFTAARPPVLPPEVIDDANRNGIKDAGEATVASLSISGVGDVILDVNGNGIYDLGSDIVVDFVNGAPTTPNLAPLAPWVNPVTTAGFTPVFANHGSSNTPPAGVPRGGKDQVQGYGMIAVDAAVEAVTKEFCAVEQDQLGGGINDKKVWARHLHLYAGKSYKALLDVPGTGDYDLYVYYGNIQPDRVANATEARDWQFGEPIILASSTQPGMGVKEEITFTVPRDGMYFLVVKRADGAGQFTVRLVTPEEWTFMVYMPAELERADLDELAFRTLNHMEETGSGEQQMRHFQVLALVDYATRGYDGNAVAGGVGAHPGDAALYCIRKDHDPNRNQFSIAKQPAEFLNLDNAGDATQRGEANMGSPDTVTGFASWAVDYFPAKKYALVFWGDGNGYGWKYNESKALGLGNDNKRVPSDAADVRHDALTMKELREALHAIKKKINAGSQYKDGTAVAKNIDLVGFDAGHMAMVEIGRQIQDSVEVMVGSEERIDKDPAKDKDGWPYGAILASLKCPLGAGACHATDPNWGAEEFGKQIVTEYHAYYGAAAHSDTRHTLSAVRLNPRPGTTPSSGGSADCATFDQLVDCLSEFAGGAQVARGVEPHAGLFGGIVFGKNKHDDPEDNVQILIKHQGREATEEMIDHNYIDLRHFAQNIKAAAFNPLYKLKVDEIIAGLTPGKAIVLAEAHGPAHPHAQGLTIYFPHDETLPENACVEAPRNDRTCGFDSPFPAKVVYALDPFIKVPILLAPPGHPRPEIPALRFPQDTLWDEFVHRYYKPVADACVKSINGVDQSECKNVAYVHVGDQLKITGEGSSDSDGPDRDDLPDHIGGEEHWYWDLNLQVDIPPGKPLYPRFPKAVLDGGSCSEDCDRNNVDDNDDDPDMKGRVITWSCPASGRYDFKVNVWDEHHDLARVHDEEDHFSHYNVDAAYVTIFCDSYGITKLPGRTTVDRGQPVSYVATMTNGTRTEARLSATDMVPPGTTLSQPSLSCPNGQCGYDPTSRQITWQAPLAPGASTSLNYTITIDPADDGPCTREVSNTIRLDGATVALQASASIVVNCPLPRSTERSGG